MHQSGIGEQELFLYQEVGRYDSTVLTCTCGFLDGVGCGSIGRDVRLTLILSKRGDSECHVDSFLHIF